MGRHSGPFSKVQLEEKLAIHSFMPSFIHLSTGHRPVVQVYDLQSHRGHWNFSFTVLVLTVTKYLFVDVRVKCLSL